MVACSAGVFSRRAQRTMSRFSAPWRSWLTISSKSSRASTRSRRRSKPNSQRCSSTQNRIPCICSIQRARRKPRQWSLTHCLSACSPMSHPASWLRYHRSAHASRHDSSQRLRRSTFSSTGMSMIMTGKRNSGVQLLDVCIMQLRSVGHEVGILHSTEFSPADQAHRGIERSYHE